MSEKPRPGGAAGRTSDTVLARDLLHVTMRMMRSVAREMRRFPQAAAPGQVGALMRLKLGPTATGELARHLGVSVPTISRSIDVLVERGWVERVANPADRRHTIVRLTSKGRRATETMRRQSERHVAALLAPLSVDQRAQLTAAFDALKDVLPLSP